MGDAWWLTCHSYQNLVDDLAHHESPIARWLERSTGIWKVMGSTLVGRSEFFWVFWLENACSLFTLYPSHQSIYQLFTFIILTHWALQYGRTHVTHKNLHLVYDLAYHKSPIAQWFEHPNCIWKVMGSTPVGGSENCFSEYFNLRTHLHYWHFIQVTNPFIAIIFVWQEEL